MSAPPSTRVTPGRGGRSRVTRERGGRRRARGDMEGSLVSGYGGAMTDPTSLPNFPPPADEHPLRGRVLDVLVDLGLRPNLDADGDVAFTANEQQLFIRDRKSTRLNSSHTVISYAVFCLKKKKK